MCSLFDGDEIPDDWYDDCDPYYRNLYPYEDEFVIEEDDRDQ